METAGNIGPRERRKRMAMGIAMLALGAALAAVLTARGAAPWWRASLFVPFWLGALGLLQARAGT
jgi:hypothetical protein